jgi:hypothetical protein
MQPFSSCADVKSITKSISNLHMLGREPCSAIMQSSTVEGMHTHAWLEKSSVKPWVWQWVLVGSSACACECVLNLHVTGLDSVADETDENVDHATRQVWQAMAAELRRIGAKLRDATSRRERRQALHEIAEAWRKR